MELGYRLKKIRRLQGLSIEEIAMRSGVSKNLLVRIEANSVSPSYTSLLQILKGFPIDVGDFFNAELGDTHQVVFRGDDQAKLRSTGVAITLHGHIMPGRRISMVQETYLPGADTGETLLKYSGEEVGLVTEGEIELTVDHDIHHLVAGDSYYFSTHLPHRFRNLGKVAAKVVSANSI
jgi:transcriptional regulator with XRE-family HTH domain